MGYLKLFILKDHSDTTECMSLQHTGELAETKLYIHMEARHN